MIRWLVGWFARSLTALHCVALFVVLFWVTDAGANNDDTRSAKHWISVFNGCVLFSGTNLLCATSDELVGFVHRKAKGSTTSVQRAEHLRTNRRVFVMRVAQLLRSALSLRNTQEQTNYGCVR